VENTTKNSKLDTNFICNNYEEGGFVVKPNGTVFITLPSGSAKISKKQDSIPGDFDKHFKSIKDRIILWN